MGIGLDLTGVAGTRADTPPDEFCQELCDWFQLHAGEVFEGSHGPNCGHDHDHDHGHDHDDEENGEPDDLAHEHDHDGEDCEAIVGTARFFPSTEALYIETGPGGTLRLSTKTSPLGPGYHRWLCGLLQQLGEEFEVEWHPFDEEGNPGDETGYFFVRDPAQVDRAMLVWLRESASMLKTLQARGYHGLGLSVPATPLFVDFGPVTTVLGPRSLEWLDRVIADPMQGIDVFPWWEDGVGALLYRNRALCRMWDSVCWRPLGDDDDQERELLEQVHFDLQAAYEADPSLSFPWREWNEVLTLLENGSDEPLNEVESPPALRQTIREFAAAARDEPLVGYRRGRVRTQITEGWSIEIPGSFEEVLDEQGNWGAVHDLRQVWVSVVRLAHDDGTKPTAAHLLAVEQIPRPQAIVMQPWKVGELHGIARFLEVPDAEIPHWDLEARCAVDGELAIITIQMPSREDLDWALGVWRSTKRVEPETDEE